MEVNAFLEGLDRDLDIKLNDDLSAQEKNDYDANNIDVNYETNIDTENVEYFYDDNDRETLDGMRVVDNVEDIDNEKVDSRYMNDRYDIEDMPVTWSESAALVLFKTVKASYDEMREYFSEFRNFCFSFGDEKVDYLVKKYDVQSMSDVHENGKTYLEPRNPIPGYVPCGGNIKDRIHNLGHTLGLIGDIGRFYILIPDLNFSRGWWQGRFEKAISEKNIDDLNAVYNDMLFYNAEKMDKELEVLNENIFNKSYDIDVKSETNVK